MEFGIYVPAEAEPIALVLEIIREGAKELSYLNRFCRNPQTKVLPPLLFRDVGRDVNGRKWCIIVKPRRIMH